MTTRCHTCNREAPCESHRDLAKAGWAWEPESWWCPSCNGEGTFEVGDRVEKASGYLWPGVVVSRFRTRAGEVRYVVECVVPEVAGALHIFNAEQLRRVP